MMDPAAARHTLQATSLPVLSPKLLTALSSTCIASPFDATAALDAAMQEPALLLALYTQAQRQDVDTAADPRDMVAALGAQGVERVVASLRLVSPPTDPAVRRWLDAGCRHALAVSRLARLLAPTAKLDADRAAMAGLMHDVGRLALLVSPLGPTALEAYEFACAGGLSNVYVERSVLGLSHKQAGRLICERSGMPADVAQVCVTHDFTDAQGSRLDPAAGELAALVALCDALAGAGTMAGDPATQLRHPPRALEPIVAAHADAIAKVLVRVEAESESRWPLCRGSGDAAEQPLASRRVALVSRSTLWHPMRATLEDAGAAVTLVPRPLNGGEMDAAIGDADVVVFDASADALALVLEDLARVEAARPMTPRLVLAQRCHEPHTRVGAIGSSCAVLTTPIRARPLVRGVALLAGGRTRRAA